MIAQTSNKRPIKLALLGCGDVAQRDYLPELHRLGNRIELVAVCGRTPERVRATAARYAVPAWYTDYRRMLAECDAEAVINLSPIQLHDETNLAIVESGRHLYSEKPFAGSLAAGQRIAEAASARGLVVVCAPSVLLFPQMRLAQTLLNQGVIGRVASARGIGYGGVPPWSGYGSDPSPFFAAGGGPLRDMGVYPLHALTGLLGPVRTVFASSTRAQERFTVADGPWQGLEVPVEEDDTWQLQLRLESGQIAIIEANNSAQGTHAPQLELLGLGGTLAINLLDVSAPVELLGSHGWQNHPIPATGRAAGPDHILGVIDLIECITEHRAPTASAQHALHVLDIIDQAIESTRTGHAMPIASSFPRV